MVWTGAGWGVLSAFSGCGRAAAARGAAASPSRAARAIPRRPRIHEVFMIVISFRSGRPRAAGLLPGVRGADPDDPGPSRGRELDLPHGRLRSGESRLGRG